MAMKSTSPLAGLLRKSPFKPIQEHMRIVFSCVCLLPPLFDALFQEDREQIKIHAEKLAELETEADKVKSTLRLHMPNTLLLPVARRDILLLISDQDEIADTSEKIGQILYDRDMKVPENIKELFDELIEGTMEIVAETKGIIEQLDELVQVGFGGGRELDKVNKMITGVRRSENNIDNILHRLRRGLFEIEEQLNPVSVIFWYKLIGLLGDISDQSENVADRLLLFLSK